MITQPVCVEIAYRFGLSGGGIRVRDGRLKIPTGNLISRSVSLVLGW